MAYKTKFLHFKTKASYEAERAKTTEGSEERKVFDAYISFIDEGPTICTWGKEYQCDANSLSLLPQEVTTEKQDQVFKNLGWKVHVISQSDIDATTSPDAAEKTKRLEATALLVKETSLIYVRGNGDSSNHYFFKINAISQLELLRISVTTGIIYSINSQFVDPGAIRYDITQTLSNSNKTLARENIDAANKNDVLPLTIDLSSQTVEDYNTALEAFNSKKPLTIFDSTDPAFRFTANVIEKEATTNDINVYFSFTGIDDANTFNTIGYVGTIKPTGEKTSSFAAIMPSNTDPKPLGPLASSGTDNAYSRSDHVHPIQESVAKLTTPRTIALTGAVSGSTTFDGSSNVSINSTLANIDASKITSGTLNADRLPEIPISKIPAAALERLYVVDSESAAVALKIQEGDVVQIGSGGPMYFCISESASTFAAKFKVFTAGAATSVPWSGVLNKPSIPEAAVDSPTRIDGRKSAAVGTSSKYAKEDHIHSTNTSMLNLNGTSYAFHSDFSSNLPMVYAPTSTGTSGQILKSTGGVPTWSDLTSVSWNTITGKPSTFTPSAHNQASNTITALTGYTKGTSTADLAVTDTLNTALGKLECQIATKTSNTGTVTSVKMTVPTGLSVSGSPITTSGTLALTYASGYSIPTTAKQTNWDTAYGWGNHASAGYLKTIPAATSSSYGGIQIGYTTSGKNYAVQLSNGKAYVNVPWTDTKTTYTAGTNISISGTTINCTYSYSLPTATASVLGGVKIGSNISVSSGTISLTSANVTSALGFTPAKTSDIPEIPIALPNPYALTINGTSYTGSSAVSITTLKPLITTTSFTGTQLSTTINAGYSYSNTLTRTVTSLNGFSESNPDAVIISTNKIFFNASNAIKMDGLGDLAGGTYYIYCLSYMANGKVAVNGAVYA